MQCNIYSVLYELKCKYCTKLMNLSFDSKIFFSFKGPEWNSSVPLPEMQAVPMNPPPLPPNQIINRFPSMQPQNSYSVVRPIMSVNQFPCKWVWFFFYCISFRKLFKKFNIVAPLGVYVCLYVLLFFVNSYEITKEFNEY